MIAIEFSPTQILVSVDGKDYSYQPESIDLDFSRTNRIIVREHCDEPLQQGEVLWDFPSYITIIHHIAS